MKNPVYLTLSRHNIYYFRFPIPKPLHPQGKATDIRVSLETRCPHEALRLARAMAIFGDGVLGVMTEEFGMDYHELRDRLAAHFKAHFERQKEKMAKDGPLSEERRASFTRAYQTADDMAKSDLELYEDDVAELMDKFGMSFTPGTPEYDLFCKTYWQASRDYYKAVLDQAGEYDRFDYRDAPATAQKPVRHSKKKLAATIDAYMAEKQRMNTWREKSAAGFRAQLDLLAEYLGPDAPLDVSSDTANDVKKMLMCIPKHSRSKPKFKDMPLRDLMALEGCEGMGPTSIGKYLQTYSAFYDWAVNRKDTGENNFKSLVEKTRSDDQVRDAFKPEQIAVILQEVIGNDSGLVKKSYQKWGVLIALYTGARLTEIAQLALEDIRPIDGIWCFDFNDEGDDNKRLKNKASRRIVPIHSRLLELGILELADNARKAGETRLLYDLPYHKQNGYGRNLSRWFNETFLPKLDMKSGRLVFHSFRHTVTTWLLQAGSDEAIAKTVIGHTLEGVTHKVYAKGYKVSQLQDAIERLNYAAN